MSEADAMDLVRNAMWTSLLAAGPAVLGTMLIGVIISLLQALTQIQEVTLTFVPKILVLLGVCAVSAPFMGAVLFGFTEEVYSHISSGF